MMNWSDGIGIGVGGWVIMAAFWLLVVAAIGWGVLNTNRSGWGSALGAVEILDRRLANGEIDAATYDELRTRLGPISRGG